MPFSVIRVSGNFSEHVVCGVPLYSFGTDVEALDAVLPLNRVEIPCLDLANAPFRLFVEVEKKTAFGNKQAWKVAEYFHFETDYPDWSDNNLYFISRHGLFVTNEEGALFDQAFLHVQRGTTLRYEAPDFSDDDDDDDDDFPETVEDWLNVINDMRRFNRQAGNHPVTVEMMDSFTV